MNSISITLIKDYEKHQSKFKPKTYLTVTPSCINTI